MSEIAFNPGNVLPVQEVLGRALEIGREAARILLGPSTVSPDLELATMANDGKPVQPKPTTPPTPAPEKSPAPEHTRANCPFLACSLCGK